MKKFVPSNFKLINAFHVTKKQTKNKHERVHECMS